LFGFEKRLINFFVSQEREPRDVFKEFSFRRNAMAFSHSTISPPPSPPPTQPPLSLFWPPPPQDPKVVALSSHYLVLLIPALFGFAANVALMRFLQVIVVLHVPQGGADEEEEEDEGNRKKCMQHVTHTQHTT
jgi:hypothetical protein